MPYAFDMLVTKNYIPICQKIKPIFINSLFCESSNFLQAPNVIATLWHALCAEWAKALPSHEAQRIITPIIDVLP